MKRLVLAIGLALALVIPLPAMAVDLHMPHENTDAECPKGYIGLWHFVNNQTGGAAPGKITAEFDTGTVYDVGPTKVNRNVQHFWIEKGHTLIDASTNLPGRLVLSEVKCVKKGA